MEARRLDIVRNFKPTRGGNTSGEKERNMKFAKLMKEQKNWTELTVLDGKKIHIFDEMAQYGDGLERFIDDYKDSKVKHYKNDGYNLIVTFECKEG